MPLVLMISHVALWVLVLAELVLILALARQVGILLGRMGRSGAEPLPLPQSLKIGTAAPTFEVKTYDGQVFTYQPPRARPLLLLFVRTSCPICQDIVPGLKTLCRAEDLDLLVVAEGEEIEKHDAFAAKLDRYGIPYTVSPELFLLYRTTSVPFAVVIGTTGAVRAKGAVNRLEHLENLVARIQPAKEKHAEREEVRA